MCKRNLIVILLVSVCCIGNYGMNVPSAHAINTSGDYEAVPPFLTAGVAPLVMLVMGRDHKLYYEAYNDASDINEDGTLDIRYSPGIDYYGYFDSYKCYKYDTTNTQFYPYRKTTDKTCNKSGSSYDYTLDEWSGNYLNYLTMSRMDTVRKVLYGGKRSTDGTETTSSSVVLERTFIPQDAHTWGKEYDQYTSGISIASVAPLPEPSVVSGATRHLFASTTLSSAGAPLLRVATHQTKRIWEWVSKERPVADNATVATGGSSGAYNDYPDNHAEYDTLVSTYANANTQYTKNVAQSGATGYVPMTNGVSTWRIDGHGNPWGDNYWPYATYNENAAEQTNYLTIFNGSLKVNTTGDYYFIANGDDAVEFIITGTLKTRISGNWYRDYDTDDVHEVSWGGKIVASAYYGGHAADGTVGDGWSTHENNDSKYRGKVKLYSTRTYDIEFRHQENTGNDSYYLYWKGPDSGNNWQIVPASAFNVSGVTLTQKTYKCETFAPSLTDYTVRVKVCDPNNDSGGNSLLESNCKRYPNGQYKPTGLLQTHGEADSMYFGMLTGSYRKNTSGGVLRKNISSFKDELTLNTGQFNTATKGIVHTINTLKITNFNYSDHSYSSNCGWIADGPIEEGECRNWANPVGEMMYETLRYYSGAGSPTSAFTYSESDDDGLDLPKPTWLNPYSGTSSFSYCAKPFMLVISDVFPSYDSNQLPGVNSNFGAGLGTWTAPGTGAVPLDVESEADEIFTLEAESSVTPHFIAQVGSDYDGTCAPKTMTGFGDVRGLCPEEPTKQGSYYSASVAYYGRKNDISGVTGTQNVNTYVVALASPLPRIEMPVGSQTITLVPFAKSVGGYDISSTRGQFQPTNSIVDFYIEELSDTKKVFRINYEDVEQGADHDMDAIAKYTCEVVTESGVSRLKVSMSSEYAAGSIIQHMGFTISGTNHDGTYLEIRDADTSADTDPDYFLDTHPGVSPYGTVGWSQNNNALPSETHPPAVTVRYFDPGSTTAATILENPLWYAAKYGGFEELGGTANAPDQQNEWDEDLNGDPDTYFYVVNPLRLEEQLNKSFAAILSRVSSGTAASVISNSRSGEGAIYQSIFYGQYEGEVKWVGEVHAFLVDAYGNIRVDTNNNKQLDLATDLIVEFNDLGLIDLWLDVDADGQLSKSTEGGVDTQQYTNLNLNHSEVKYLWNSSNWLNEIDAASILLQRDYGTADNKRYIFTFVDADQNMVASSMMAEQKAFALSSPADLPTSDDLVDSSKIFPYIQPYPPFSPPAYVTAISGVSTVLTDYLQRQTRRVLHYIRGADQAEYISTTSPSYTVPAFRSRQADYDSDGADETWRLGDVIHSTPTVIGRPSENYDLIYRDSSYSDFYVKYRNRRSVIYCGANDGMFHAFNGGFYDDTHKKFETKPLESGTTEIMKEDGGAYTQYALGSELWAYVPHNLLPHLYWLTDPNYAHMYYCDSKPKIFDAKVFPGGESDTKHPNGWGTLLVGGMRLGGGKIQADMDKTDGSTFIDGTDRTMRSAFFILDITDPESPPEVLAELAFPNAGYSTCYPTAIPMLNRTVDGSGNVTFTENKWYLVFGSGPADAAGEATKDPLTSATSLQPAKLFVVDLVELVTNHQLKTLNNAGVFETYPTLGTYASLDSNAFVSDVISVDYDLDFTSDAVYFGTVEGSAGSWGGKMRRIVINDDLVPANWDSDSVMLDLTHATISGTVGNGQPITAAPSIALDSAGNRWVYFGTGRFYERTDASNGDQQSFYGVKETKSGASWTWGTVTRSDLLNVSNAIVYEDGTDVDNVTGPSGSVDNWDELLLVVDGESGWLLDFPNDKERNLGQATLLGDILTFTTYEPSLDPCEFEGYTYLYATYYKTGTAYNESIIGLGTRISTETGKQEVLRRTSLGKGLSITPNIHTGREEGSKVFVQTSTGAIEVLQQANPGMTKSGRVSWKEED